MKNEVKFYEFNQNNSGGSFIVNDKVCHRLFIEAESEEKAVSIAESLGCYWDGVDEGIDCPCCGDRWHDSPDSVDLKRYKSKGYPAYENIEYHTQSEWFEKYGSFKRKAEPKNVTDSYSTKFGTEVFESIEEYAQYMSNEYGWTNPDCRIFYKNGIIKEIFSSKEK